MKNIFSTFLLVPVFCLFVAGFLLSVQTGAKADEMIGVKIMEKEVVGKFLADGKGITLYSFSKDTENVSNCIEGCAVNWPPFHVDPSAVTEGCESRDFASITRSDGRQQTTYKGMPLYYFKDDKYPGDTFGQGIGGVWSLVTP
jgi:predicted lipoprotein with Yx(FWY)xxD motif